MKINFKATGIEKLKVQLRNYAAKVPEGARKAMHRVADKIVMEARLNAPVDKHNLEKSIKKVLRYGGRGRLSIDIEMGGYVDGVDVDLYAVQIHENYSSMKPGAGTVAKRQANPGRLVGEKFLTRALESVKPRINRDILDAVMVEIENAD